MGDLVAKLEKWVKEHPMEADLPVMNVTTGRTFTTRQILEELKMEKETGVQIVDEDVLEVKKHIEDWIQAVGD